MNSRKISKIFLVQLLAGAGILHLLPKTGKQYDQIVPTQLPGEASFWTKSSGLAELSIAGLIASKKTTNIGKKLATLLFIAVFPANVKMAIDWQKDPSKSKLSKVLGWLRLPLQIPLILIAAKK